jgi:hypothetical protein
MASIPDASGVIHGCRKTSGGALRVIDTGAGQTCMANETALNWEAGARPGTLYGWHHLSETVDVQVSPNPQTFFFECPAGEQAISAAAILYRVDGQEYRAEPPTEVAGIRATFSFVNPYTEPTQLQAGYNCAKVA